MNCMTFARLPSRSTLTASVIPVAIIDGGKIVAEGTPAQLKERVGEPTLRVALKSEADGAKAEATLGRFGEAEEDVAGYVSIRLQGGATKVAEVVGALGNADVAIESLELHTPTLDDVFQQATGRRLEGSAQDAELESATEPS